MAWLPWHVTPGDGDCTCENPPGRFGNVMETDGTTYAYICTGCGELIADLICGAEP